MAPVIELGSVVEDFATGVYSVRRFRTGTYEQGVWTPGAGGSDLIEVSAVVVPAQGQDLLRLDDSDRTRETLTVLTTTQLYLGTTNRRADRLRVDNGDGLLEYEIQHVDNWMSAAGFYKYIAAKVDAE